MRSGKWEAVMPLPPNFFSVDSYNLKSLSFEFGNIIFITFEILRVAYNRPVRKINISLLFRPSVISPWLNLAKQYESMFETLL